MKINNNQLRRIVKESRCYLIEISHVLITIPYTETILSKWFRNALARWCSRSHITSSGRNTSAVFIMGKFSTWPHCKYYTKRSNVQRNGIRSAYFAISPGRFLPFHPCVSFKIFLTFMRTNGIVHTNPVWCNRSNFHILRSRLTFRRK